MHIPGRGVATLDFDHLICGISLVFLGAAAVALSSKRRKVPWPYLTAFALLHSVTEWLDIIEFQFKHEAFNYFRVALIGVSFFFLLLFGTKGLNAHGKKIPRFLPLFLAALAFCGVPWGPTAFHMTIKYALALSGGCATAWLFFEANRHEPLLGLRVASASMLLQAMFSGLFGPEGNFFPTVPFVSTILIFITASSLWYSASYLARLDFAKILQKDVAHFQQKEEIAKSMALYQATVEATGDGVMVLDNDLHILHYNDRVLEMWELPRALIESRDYAKVRDFCFKKVRNSEEYRAIVETPRSPTKYFIIELLDGRAFERQSASQIIDGKIVGLIVIFRDISERRKIERDREEMQRRVFLSQKLASIGQLAAGVAHEINNPLSIVKGYIGVIQDELRQKGSDEKFITILDKQDLAVNRIANIVTGLRTYARSDTDHVENVNIHRAISDTLSLIDHIYRKDGITIISRLDAEHPIVRGNTGKLQQVLMNLLTNAKDALETKSEGNKFIGIETKMQGSNFVLTLWDTGCGIPQSTLDRIFDAFYTTKPPGKGTGLGLAITHSIIHSMNGRVEASSKVDEGTQFTLTFPVVFGDEETQNDPSQLAIAQPRLSGVAFVIDDEAEIRAILTEHLRSAGLSVETAEDGLAAFQELRRKHYDFIITDLKMPGLDGMALLVEARKLGHLKDTAIIVMTGGIVTEYTPEQRQHIRQLADGYLRKPFTKNELIKMLSQLR